MLKVLLLLLVIVALAHAASKCEDITDEKSCMSASQGSSKCAWCTSGAVGASCSTEDDAKSLPSSVFSCTYQKAYKSVGADKKCEDITDQSTCMSSTQGDENCAWCTSGAVGTSCSTESDAKSLPASVFSCDYQQKYYKKQSPVHGKKNVGAKRLRSSHKAPRLSSQSECQVASELKNAGFPSSTIGTMVCIAKHESGLNPGATNKNNDGSTDYGLFQINSYYWCSGDPMSKYNECGQSCQTLLNDPQKNTNCAKKVYNEQGYNAWYGYQYHKAECDAYTVNC